MRWALDRAAALGVELVCGPFHSAYKVFTGQPPTEDERRWCAESLHAFAAEAQQRGLRLATEALNRFECYVMTTMAEARALVRAADHPALAVHYDTHHMHIEEPDPAAAIAHVAAELGHVHVSENDRGVPGTGQVNWTATFRALHEAGYDGWLTIESFSRLDPEFAGAIHVWRDYFGDPMDVATGGHAFIRESWAGVV